MDNGGYLHPVLEIHVKQGQMKIESRASSPEPMVQLPGSSLLPNASMEARAERIPGLGQPGELIELQQQKLAAYRNILSKIGAG